MRKIGVCALTCLAIASVAVAVASKWSDAANSSGGEKKTAIACGSVSGELGCIWGWTNVAGTPDDTIFSHADIGYKWNGDQLEHAVMPLKVVDDIHYHT